MNNKLIILLLFIPTMAFSKKVINSGHQTPVKFIEYLDSEKSFFSLSEDGTLVIKKVYDEKITRRFFLTGNTINQLILSNTNDRLAVVESDNTSKFIISVWNWKLEKKLYSINLDEFPMSIGFSGGGNYIFVSSIASTPVKVFNARTGASTTFLNKNRSYIDYLYIGSSETAAFLYSSSSGTLDIRKLKDSKLIKSIKTEKNLSDMTITSDKKYLIARKDNFLYIIGRNDGKLYEKKRIDDLSFFKINDTTGEVLCYINSRYKKTIKSLQVVAGNFFESSVQDILMKNQLEVIGSAYNIILYADDKGNMESYDTWNRQSSSFLTNDILNIEDITIIDDTAALLTSDTILLFQSPFFSDKNKNSRRLLDSKLNNFISPLKNPIGSLNLNGNLLLWNSSLVLFDIITGETIFNHRFSSNIVDIKIKDNQLLALDKNGIVKIINLKTKKVTFSFKSPGFTSVVFYNENEIIGGVDKSQGGSLMTLDIKTKETLPLKTSLDVVFNILESNRSYIIYITGLKNINGVNNTYIIEFNLLTNTEKRLFKNGSEELDSSYEVDKSNTIYTNLGTKSILKLNTSSRRVKPFQSTTNQTKHILYENGAVYTINENRSLSIWHPTSGKKLIDFYLFKDKNWVAISQNSISAFGSPGSNKYISSN